MTRGELRYWFSEWIDNYYDELYLEDELTPKVANSVLTALRPVSREQVEKVWRGEWIIQQDEHKEYQKKCSECGFPISGWWGADKFCANCGAPMTDEAVEMVMERLEALNGGITPDRRAPEGEEDRHG